MDVPKKPCPLCGTEAIYSQNNDTYRTFYACPVCGQYDLGAYGDLDINYNHLLSYLVHHRFKPDNIESRYHTTLDKDICDQHKKEFKQGTGHRWPVHMDAEIIENWYPKTFSERVDYILLYINENAPHVGQEISWSIAEALAALFIDRYEIGVINYGKHALRDEDDWEHEIKYMLDYLQESSYIKYTDGPDEEEAFILSLSPNGYRRVDELQKYSSHGRNVLVAMKFGDDTKKLREAIRKGISEAKYNAIFIDEVQHNDFITPELLKYIRDSKFVVVDLTHQNNGAYFEEGYAMGLGKPVIQLCQKGKTLHFDIAQKNTIMWTTEDDIPERLTNRIKATID